MEEVGGWGAEEGGVVAGEAAGRLERVLVEVRRGEEKWVGRTEWEVPLWIVCKQ